MRLKWIPAALLALGLSAPSPGASALTLPVVGGPGLTQWEICTASNPCPGTPLWSLAYAGAVAGSFTYDPGTSRVAFALTFVEDASAGLPLIAAGTTISATDIPVIATPLSGGGFVLQQSGGAAGVFDPLIVQPIGVQLSQNSPSISGLICTVGTGADHCAVSVGSAGIEILAPPLLPLTTFLAFEVNVPEPGTALLLAGGLAGLAAASRRRV